MEGNQDTGETMSEGSPMGTEASTTAEGQEKENSSSLSPEFIKMSHSLVYGASEEQLQYIMDCCNEEMNEGGTNEAKSSDTPEQYSSDDMPKD